MRLTLNNITVFCILALVNAIFLAPHFNNALCVDDPSYVSKQNVYFANIHSLLDFFTKPKEQHYSPLCHLTNYILFKFFPDNPLFMRLFNFLLHVTGCFLIYKLIKKLGLKNQTAFGAAFLFSLHPFNAETIYHISENFVSLMGIFMSLSLLCVLAIKNEPNRARVYTLLGCFLFFIALLFWEFAILLPAYLFCFYICFEGLNLKRSVQKLWPWLSIAAVFIVIWLITGEKNTGLFDRISALGLSPGQYIAGITHLFLWYLINLLYPFKPVIIYNIPLEHLKLWSSLPIILMSLAMLFLIFKKLRKDKIKFFFFLWVLTGFLPTFLTTFIFSDMGLVFEPHWLYYSSIGFFVLLNIHFEEWFGKRAILFNTVIILTGLYLGVATYLHGKHWKNNITYGEYWLSSNPKNYIAWKIMAKEYYNKKEYEKALTHFQKVLDLTVSNAYVIHNYMASIYDKTGRIDLAKKHLDLSLVDNPSYAETYNILGSIEGNRRDYVKARDYFFQAHKLDPDNVSIAANLAQVYIVLKDFDNAQKLIDSLNLNVKFSQ